MEPEPTPNDPNSYDLCPYGEEWGEGIHCIAEDGIGHDGKHIIMIGEPE